MGLIEYYIIFALSTSLACWYLFFWPILNFVKSKGVDNEFTRYPILSSVIYIIVSAIIAPVLIFPLLFPNSAVSFRRGLLKSISGIE